MPSLLSGAYTIVENQYFSSWNSRPSKKFILNFSFLFWYARVLIFSACSFASSIFSSILSQASSTLSCMFSICQLILSLVSWLGIRESIEHQARNKGKISDRIM